MKKRDRLINFRVSDEEYEDFRWGADRRGTTLTKLIKDSLRRVVASERRKEQNEVDA